MREVHVILWGEFRVVGLAYYQLGAKHVNVIVSATIPNNTALIITTYKAFRPNATINIAGSGRENIKLIISVVDHWIYFPSNFLRKQVFYQGYNKDAVIKMAQNEFGKKANVIYSSSTSPVDISVFYYGKY